MVLITRKFNFSASHRIFKPDLSDKENFKIFGKCSNPTGHGHNYKMEVTVTGKVSTDTGYLMDLTKLKEIVNENIIQYVDHKNLNTDVPFMKDVIPTTENIAIEFWKVLRKKINTVSGVWLYSIKIYETDNNFVEFRGDNG